MRCRTSLLLEMPKFDPWMRKSGGVDDQLVADSLMFQMTEAFDVGKEFRCLSSVVFKGKATTHVSLCVCMERVNQS